jgi:hypothetical protein
VVPKEKNGMREGKEDEFNSNAIFSFFGAYWVGAY